MQITKTLKTLKWQNFILLTVSGIINAIGVTMFLAPVGLYDGGFSGTSMLLWQVTPDYMTLSIFLLILNLPFFLFGLKKQGLIFTVYSIYAIAIFSLASYIIQFVLPVNVATSSPIAGTDLFLCAVFGGLISGVGSGLTIRQGGAIDGVEVMAVIFAKRIGLTVGTFVMAYNAILYIIAGIVTSSFIIPLYSLVAYAVGLKAVDFIVDGLDKGKAALIITENSDAVCKELSELFGRGLTIVDAEGYYSKTSKKIVYCVVNRFQIGKLKRTVKTVDPNAFVAISEVTDSLGSQFKINKPSLSTFKRSQSSAVTAGNEELINSVAENSAVIDTPINQDTPLSDNLQEFPINNTKDLPED